MLRAIAWLTALFAYVVSCVPSGMARAQAVEPQSIDLTLRLGEQRVVPSEGVVSFSEGVEGIVDVRVTPESARFVVVGLKVGQTTLLLIMKDGSTRLYRIEVRDPDQPERDEGRVEARDNIRLDFYFVQLDRNGSLDAGTRWPRGLGGGAFQGGFDFVTGALTPTTAVVNAALVPSLELAQSRGWAKVLRQASVITASGTTADFSSGGEVNIPIVNAVSSGVEAIRFGSTVKVSPRYDEQTGRIEMWVEAELSDLTVSPGADVPGRSTSSLHTLVNMELGQSLVLAGLSARSEARSRSGVPGLSQIPILGGLFGMHARRRSETENLIYIIPSLVEASEAEVRRELQRALRAFEAYGPGSEPSLSPVATEAQP